MTQHQDGGEFIANEWTQEFQTPFYDALDTFDKVRANLLDHTALVATTPPDATWEEVTTESTELLEAYDQLLKTAYTEPGELGVSEIKDMIASITLGFLNDAGQLMRGVTKCKEFSDFTFKPKRTEEVIAHFDEIMGVEDREDYGSDDYRRALVQAFSEKTDLLFNHYESHFTEDKKKNKGMLVTLALTSTVEATIKDSDQKQVSFAFAIEPPLKSYDSDFAKDFGITHSTNKATYGAIAVGAVYDTETGEVAMNTVVRAVGSVLQKILDPLGRENISIALQSQTPKSE